MLKSSTMNETKIRKYQSSDMPFLCDFELWRNGVGACVESITASERVICLVAEYDGLPIGFICGENTLSYGNILIAAEVAEDFRKQGVFTKLLSEYKKYARGNITVFHNDDLTEFYQKCGFCTGANLCVSMYEK